VTQIQGRFVTYNKSEEKYRIFMSVLLSALVLTAGAAASYGLSLLRKPPDRATPSNRQYSVEIISLKPIDLQEIVHAFGTAKPEKEVVVSAQLAGEITEIHPHLKVGIHVVSSDRKHDAGAEENRSNGDLLLRIDPRSYTLRVEAARHHLEEDQAELRKIEQEEGNLKRVYEKIVADWEDTVREYQKIAQLREKQISTDSDLRRAQMELRQYEKAKIQSNNERDLFPFRREQTKQRMESHATDLEISLLELTKTLIRPPFDGVLSLVNVERGQYVRVGEPLLTITSSMQVEVALSVTLEDYAKLLPNVFEQQYSSVELAENETANPRWTGHVVRVSPKADEQTRTATVYVLVDNSTQDTPLLPGTFVHARVNGPILKQILAVPRDAVLNGKAFVERDGIVSQRTVKIRRTLHGLALIDGGLESGDRVVLTNHDTLFEGALVNPSAERTLGEELAKQSTYAVKIIEPRVIFE